MKPDIYPYISISNKEYSYFPLGRPNKNNLGVFASYLLDWSFFWVLWCPDQSQL